MKYTIEDLAKGRCAAEFTGSIAKLDELLKLAFPYDNDIAAANFTYYYKHEDCTPFWDCNDITSLPTQKVEDFFEQEKTFPRVMLVSNFNDIKRAVKRVVFITKNGKYIAWDDAETLEQAEKIIYTYTWLYAWELEEKKTISATEAKAIIDNATGEQKEKLAEMWGKDIVLGNDVKFSNELKINQK